LPLENRKSIGSNRARTVTLCTYRRLLHQELAQCTEFVIRSLVQGKASRKSNTDKTRTHTHTHTPVLCLYLRQNLVTLHFFTFVCVNLPVLIHVVTYLSVTSSDNS